MSYLCPTLFLATHSEINVTGALLLHSVAFSPFGFFSRRKMAFISEEEGVGTRSSEYVFIALGH